MTVNRTVNRSTNRFRSENLNNLVLWTITPLLRPTKLITHYEILNHQIITVLLEFFCPWPSRFKFVSKSLSFMFFLLLLPFGSHRSSTFINVTKLMFKLILKSINHEVSLSNGRSCWGTLMNDGFQTETIRGQTWKKECKVIGFHNLSLAKQSF